MRLGSREDKSTTGWLPMAVGLGTQEEPTLSWDDSPCHLLLLSTSHWHSSSCKSSPRPLSIRRVPACLLRRSRSERWQYPGLWDLALGRNNAESESVCGWSQPATRTQSEHGCWCRAVISLQVSDDDSGVWKQHSCRFNPTRCDQVHSRRLKNHRSALDTFNKSFCKSKVNLANSFNDYANTFEIALI